MTPTVLYALVKFQKDNPKTFEAFVDALREATAWIATHPKDAAQTFIHVENSKLPPTFIAARSKSRMSNIQSHHCPSKKFADFLYRIGAIKTSSVELERLRPSKS